MFATAEKQGNSRLLGQDMWFRKTTSYTNIQQGVCLPGDPTAPAAAALKKQQAIN
jgi:hypothetical protein